MVTVSVVIATYKRPELLTRAIRCATAQTLQEIEVIVVAEVGDTATVTAVEGENDPRVRFVMNPVKNGPGPARDKGARESTGTWIAFLDDDDEWAADKLEKQLATAGNRRDVIVTCLSRVVSSSGTLIRPIHPFSGGPQPIDEWLFDRQSWFGANGSMLQTSSLMMPTSLFDTLGFGNVQHEEWELSIRAIKQGGFSLLTVHEPLVTYYVGRLYSWRGSIAWADSMREIITPRAYSGFCLTVITQGLPKEGRNRAFVELLTIAFQRGKPSMKQLIAFSLIWLLPHKLRQLIRIATPSRA